MKRPIASLILIKKYFRRRKKKEKIFLDYHYQEIKRYSKEKGKLEYDIRKLKGNKDRGQINKNILRETLINFIN